MGIFYYTCSREDCGETFPDCGRYVTCDSEVCGCHWCSDKCAEADGRREEEFRRDTNLTDEENDKASEGFDVDGYKVSCNWCRQDDTTDGALLLVAMKWFNVSREELLDRWKSEEAHKLANL